MARTAAATGRKKKNARPPGRDEILGHFCDALSLAETAYSALDAVQERPGVGRAIGAAVTTLELGLTELRRAYTELDLAFLRQRKGGAS